MFPSNRGIVARQYSALNFKFLSALYNRFISTEPSFNLPRHTWSLLNRFQTGQGPCRANLHRWGLVQWPSCDCGQRQTMNHNISRHVPTNKWTETTARSRWWWRSHVAGINSDHSTHEMKQNSIRDTAAQRSAHFSVSNKTNCTHFAYCRAEKKFEWNCLNFLWFSVPRSQAWTRQKSDRRTDGQNESNA